MRPTAHLLTGGREHLPRLAAMLARTRDALLGPRTTWTPDDGSQDVLGFVHGAPGARLATIRDGSILLLGDGDDAMQVMMNRMDPGVRCRDAADALRVAATHAEVARVAATEALPDDEADALLEALDAIARDAALTALSIEPRAASAEVVLKPGGPHARSTAVGGLLLKPKPDRALRTTPAMDAAVDAVLPSALSINAEGPGLAVIDEPVVRVRIERDALAILRAAGEGRLRPEWIAEG